MRLLEDEIFGWSGHFLEASFKENKDKVLTISLVEFFCQVRNLQLRTFSLNSRSNSVNRFSQGLQSNVPVNFGFECMDPSYWVPSIVFHILL